VSCYVTIIIAVIVIKSVLFHFMFTERLVWVIATSALYLRGFHVPASLTTFPFPPPSRVKNMVAP
jgi:hypothetical protein